MPYAIAHIKVLNFTNLYYIELHAIRALFSNAPFGRKSHIFVAYGAIAGWFCHLKDIMFVG